MAQMRSNLGRIAKTIIHPVGDALMQTGRDILEISQQLVPVDTGKLKASGGVEQIDKRTVQVGYGTPGSEREDVALYVEYGTVNMDAQPYLTPAFAQSAETFKARMQEAIDKAISGIT